MGTQSLFNVMGAVAVPVWLVQVGCYALIGCAGGIVGPKLSRGGGRARVAVLSALTGAALVFVYQIVVNVVAFYTFTNDVDVWVYVWGGIAFGAVQVGWNVVVFGVAMPPRYHS
jgi:hypothetical protein